MNTIENKVAQSGIIQLDLSGLSPAGKRMGFDMKDHLFQGLVLREKPFREMVSSHDWQAYNEAYVHVYCSADAVVPNWAYMLVASALTDKAKRVCWGDRNAMEDELLIQTIKHLKAADFIDQRVMVKGCSDRKIGEGVYMALTQKLQPWVKTLMFGEPCSSVPVFKRKS